MFQAGVLYRPDDEKLTVIFKRQTWAKMRCDGRGPNFLRIGGRVFYEGETLNQWFASHTKRTTDKKATGAAA